MAITGASSALHAYGTTDSMGHTRTDGQLVGCSDDSFSDRQHHTQVSDTMTQSFDRLSGDLQGHVDKC